QPARRPSPHVPPGPCRPGTWPGSPESRMATEPAAWSSTWALSSTPSPPAPHVLDRVHVTERLEDGDTQAQTGGAMEHLRGAPGHSREQLGARAVQGHEVVAAVSRGPEDHVVRAERVEGLAHVVAGQRRHVGPDQGRALHAAPEGVLEGARRRAAYEPGLPGGAVVAPAP